MKPRSLVMGVVLAGAITGPGAAQEPSAAVPPAAPAAADATEAGAAASDDELPRDPFRPFLNLRKSIGPETPKVGLQAYDVRQLKLVAVMWDLNPPRALVQDAAGMGFIVAPGTPIGRKDGVVAVIEPGRVIVEEKTVDFRNNVQITREIMEIPRADEPQRVGRERK